MADDPLAPSPKATPAPAGTPSGGPTGGSFEETIRSNKELKPEQVDAILAAHKSEVDRGITGARKNWETKELPEAAESKARKIADEIVTQRLAAAERTARNKEIVNEEFGIKLRGSDGQPTDESKEMAKKIAKTCEDLGIDKDIALATDKGVRGLMIAAGYQPLAKPAQEEFGPQSGLPASMRREAAAAAAKDPAKQTPWEKAAIDDARAIQELMNAGGA